MDGPQKTFGHSAIAQMYCLPLPPGCEWHVVERCVAPFLLGAGGACPSGAIFFLQARG